MKGLITPEIADSPIGRLKNELVDTVQREVGDIAEEVRRVTEHLGIVDATDDVYEQTTAKGFDYEDLVDECVGTLAAGYGDLAEVTAKESGSHASQVGDEVVTLNRDDTHGVEARFALEMKNRPLNMRKTMAELDEALCNRDALAAIAVFRSQDQAPTSVPFQYYDDKAIVVFDPDDDDESALRLAYMWARWTVRKGLAVSEEAESTSSGSAACSTTRPRARAPHRDQAVPHAGQEEHRPGRRPGPRPGRRGAREPRRARRRAPRLNHASLAPSLPRDPARCRAMRRKMAVMNAAVCSSPSEEASSGRRRDHADGAAAAGRLGRRRDEARRARAGSMVSTERLGAPRAALRRAGARDPGADVEAHDADGGGGRRRGGGGAAVASGRG